MKRTAIYPGSFDPVTNGHLDIIERGRHLFDRVIVAVSRSPQKSPYFSLDERLVFLRAALKGRAGVAVESFTGLVADQGRVRHLDIGDALGSRRQSVVGYSTARIITMIAITTAHDSTERPAMTTTACPLGKRTSTSIGGPSLVRLWSIR